jgi:hypothetical protein
MNSVNSFTRRFFIVALLVLGSTGAVSAQNQPSGGHLPATPAKPKTESKPRSTSPPRETRQPNSTPRSSGQVERIDGKWWTVGNGFGDSEVVFTQNGSKVTGEIHYADGRTGTIEGTLTGKRLLHTWKNSTGDGGSGWLELSWANFLGGAWHNAKVKDGSWALRRIEGQWCFGGLRNRIRRVTHDHTGAMTIVTEDGTRTGGKLEGARMYLVDDDDSRLEGTMLYKGTRVDWQNGSYWTWCGR